MASSTLESFESVDDNDQPRIAWRQFEFHRGSQVISTTSDSGGSLSDAIITEKRFERDSISHSHIQNSHYDDTKASHQQMFPDTSIAKTQASDQSHSTTTRSSRLSVDRIDCDTAMHVDVWIREVLDSAALYGMHLWPCAEMLAAYLYDQRHTLKLDGRTIIEVCLSLLVDFL
jgi:hypothetical protein